MSQSDDIFSSAEQSPSPATEGRLLPWAGDAESRTMRIIGWMLALAVTAGFFVFVLHYFAPGPGNPGIDENAYLVAGKNIAHHLTPGMHPSDPFAFVGPMWIRTDSGWYYPKYPSGLPMLNAVAIWISGGHNIAAYYVSPICAALAVLAMFLLTRALAGSFWGVLAAVILATNATLLHLAIIPSSHAPAIAFSLWGIVALVHWWRKGKLWAAIAAGFLLGYTCTIRYSEGLLLAPLGFVAITMIRWTNWKSYLRSAVAILAWLVPVGSLVLFNHFATGHWTGYDSTHESTGFTLAEFERKWQFTITEMYLYGLFLLLPLGLMGMMFLFGRSWRLASMLVLWFVPPALLYTAYYWGQQTPGVGFLRFFLTLYPPVIAASLWFVAVAGEGVLRAGERAHRLARERAAQGPPPLPEAWTSRRRLSITAAICASLLIGVVGAVGIFVELPDLKFQHTYNANAAYSAKELVAAISTSEKSSPSAAHAEPLLLSETDARFSRLLMQLQFDANGDWYSTDAFDISARRQLNPMRGNFNAMANMNGQNDPDQPQPVLIQPERIALQEKLYANLTQQDLSKKEKEILDAALSAGRGVYAIMPPASMSELRRRLGDQGFECVSLAHWQEPLKDEPADDAQNGGPNGAGPMPGPPGGNQRGNFMDRFNRGNGRRGNRMGGPGGGGGGFNPRRFMMARDNGGLAPPARGMGMTEEPRMLEVVQIVRRPPVTPTPAPAPAQSAARDAPKPAPPARPATQPSAMIPTH